PIFNYSHTSPYSTYEAPIEPPKVEEISPLEYLTALQKLRAEKGEEDYREAWAKLDPDQQLQLLQMLGKEPSVPVSHVREMVQREVKAEIKKGQKKALKIYAYVVIAMLILGAVVGLF